MKLSVACNFDETLIDGLKGYPVYELYGKVTEDFVGGGRPSFFLPPINKKRVESFVAKTHANGIAFNYLLNALCMSNLEYTKQGQREIRKILDWLTEIKCDSVTVTNLYLLRFIKKNYPHFKVRVSAINLVDSARKARFWENEGADCIVLGGNTIAREFGILKSIRDGVKCDLSIVVNNACRKDCPLYSLHAASISHNSQKQSGQKQTPPLDYIMLSCINCKLSDPVNFIRAEWIRPEDLHHYEAIGINNFKIVERNTPTPDLIRRVHAYSNRHYDGNLFDLILPFNYPIESYEPKTEYTLGRLRALKYFFKPFQFEISKFFQLARLSKKANLLHPREGKSPLYIENRALDGFIDKCI